MTTRRHFLAGLLATAAAPAIPAQPATDFTGWFLPVSDPRLMVNVPHRIWFDSGALEVRWSAIEDFNAWGKA